MGWPEHAWADALRRERAGDASGYAPFLEEYAGLLRRVIRRRLSDWGLAVDETEDVVQEVLIAIHQRRDQWDERRPLLPWLSAISRYKVVDALRRRRTERRMRVDLDERAWLQLMEAGSAMREETGQAVEAMVSTLPRVEQSVVRSIGLQGLSPREAAAATGMKEGTVRVAFHRGLARLLKLAKGGEV